MSERDDALRLYGTDEPVPALRVLAAGALECEFEAGAMRCVRWRGVELLRGVSYLLRDRDWGTAPARLEALQLDESPERFVAQFVLRMAIGDAELTAQARIEGHADGRFAFDVSAAADAALASSRCGFVVLHPAACAGGTLAVEHTDGRVAHTRFPEAISPGQPVFDIRALRWSPAPGLYATCRLKADLPGRPNEKFEMEDQRNWSDASFKTYVGSLLDPWPYTVPACTSFRQTVTLALHETLAAPPQAVAACRRTAPLQWGDATGVVMPPIGLGVPHLGAGPDAGEQAAVEALKPAWLVVQLDLGRADGAAQLDAAQSLAVRIGAAVQLDVVCPDDASPEHAAAQVALACRGAGLAPAALRLLPRAYLKSYQPSGRWPEVAALEHCARALRAAFPAARIGGGMFTNFTELNRRRQRAEAIDFIGHTNCPIVHAADDRSVMETLEALPAMARTVREVWPGLGWRIGPLALAAARNPYGNAPAANPQGHCLPLADRDPRHHGQFGAAWCAAQAAVLVPLGVELLALLDSHGPSGPMPVDGPATLNPAATVPAWWVLRELTRWNGRPLVGCDGGPPGVQLLATGDGAGGLDALAVNTTAEPVDLALGRWFTVTCDGAASAPAGECLTLRPYGVVVLRG